MRPVLASAGAEPQNVLRAHATSYPTGDEHCAGSTVRSGTGAEPCGPESHFGGPRDARDALFAEPAGQYLTPAEKAHTLEAWESGAGESSYADEGVRPLVARLNAIEGVCTVQSCIGHVRESREDGSRYVENGCIEMRLDESRTAAFYASMARLRAVEGVDDVAISWRTPYQVCNVWFAPGRIEAVVDALVEILAPPLVQNEGASRSEGAFW